MFLMNYGFPKDWGNYAYTIKETSTWLSTYYWNMFLHCEWIWTAVEIQCTKCGWMYDVR